MQDLVYSWANFGQFWNYVLTITCFFSNWLVFQCFYLLLKEFGMGVPGRR